jgi:hypothetical protein
MGKSYEIQILGSINMTLLDHSCTIHPGLFGSVRTELNSHNRGLMPVKLAGRACTDQRSKRATHPSSPTEMRTCSPQPSALPASQRAQPPLAQPAHLAPLTWQSSIAPCRQRGWPLQAEPRLLGSAATWWQLQKVQLRRYWERGSEGHLGWWTPSGWVM